VAQLQEVFADELVFDGELVARRRNGFRRRNRRGHHRSGMGWADEDFDKLAGCCSAPWRSARNDPDRTPYFLRTEMISAQFVEALRRGGGHLLPAGQLPFCVWASRAYWWQVWNTAAASGSPRPVRSFETAGGGRLWSSSFGQLGSAQLRLNFEFNVECYDADLATTRRWLTKKRQWQNASRSRKLIDVVGSTSA